MAVATQPRGLPDVHSLPKCMLAPRLPLTGPLRRPCTLSSGSSPNFSPPASPNVPNGASGGGVRLPRFPTSPQSSAPTGPPSPSRLRPLGGSQPTLSQSQSAPTVGSDTGLLSLPFGGTIWEAERHRRHVMLSPQGLFARTMPPMRFGAMACERFHQLGMEETRRGSPDARRNQLRPASAASSRSVDLASPRRSCSKGSVASRPASAARSSRPPSSKTEDNEDTWSRRPSLSPTRAASSDPRKWIRDRPQRQQDAATFREYQNKRDLYDFREGLRVAMLGTKPPNLGANKVWPPPADQVRQGSREETLKVYKQYNEWIRQQEGRTKVEEDQFMIAIDTSSEVTGKLDLTVDHCPWGKVCVSKVDNGPLADWNVSRAEEGDLNSIVRVGDFFIEVNGYRGEARELLSRCGQPTLLHILVERPRTLTPISWATFNNWAQLKAACAFKPQEKAVYTAMCKAQKALLKFQMRSKQRQAGLSLTALMRWCWPTLRPSDIASMYTWLCHHELQAITLPTPRVISKDKRRQIEGIFQEMDWGGKGYLTSTDFSGGENQDVGAMSKNCVDEETVQKVLGEQRIELPRFLELMCEDNFRGHENATEAILEGGLHVVEQVRDCISFRGWVLQEVPKSEESIWRRIDALEAQVKIWRAISRGKLRERECDLGPSLHG